MSKESTNLTETVIDAGHTQSLRHYLQSIWTHVSLLWVLAAKDIRVKYKQAIFGIGWIVLSPLLTVGVFTLVFGMMIQIPSDGLPYLLFYLVALIPWHGFVAMLNQTIQALEINAALVSRLYFPRVLFGGSYVLSAGLDYLVGFCLVLVIAILYHRLSVQLIIVAPILFFMQAIFAVGLGFILSPLSTRYGDVRLAVPLLLQLYYFANPILYPVSKVPQWLRICYDLNPLSITISAYRDALKGQWPSLHSLSTGLLVASLIFMIGFSYFRKQEQLLVDEL